MDKIIRHIMITGKVQGVGYRAFVLRNAEKLNVKGWVRNKYNGEVEAIISGSKTDIEKMLQKLRKGPRWASVDKVNIINDSIKDEFNQFRIRY